MLYEVEVEEIVHNTVLYTVEADNLEEANKKAANGETFAEELVKNHGVIDRHVHNEPVLVFWY